MKKVLRTVHFFVVMCSVLAAFYSCSKDAEKEFDPAGLNKTDVSAVLNADDISGLTDSILTDIFKANNQSGKSSNSGKGDTCIVTTFNATGYTSTFDNCSVNGATNVNGTIAVTFALENGTIAYSATYTNFSIGDITIEGTKNIILNSNSNATVMSLSITSNMTIVLEDGTVVKETGTKNFRGCSRYYW